MSESNPQTRNTPVKVTTATYTEISGPIPPPQVLQQYNNTVPGAAERIITMAEKQSNHRIYLEKRVVDSGIHKSYLGMILAAAIAIYGLYIAKEIAINGKEWAAAIVIALDLGGLISVAIYNGSVQRKEREKRRETSSAAPAASNS